MKWLHALISSVVLASQVYAGIITTVTCAAENTNPPCASGTTYSNFAPTLQFSESVQPPEFSPLVLPADSWLGEAETMDITLYTMGPARPGYLHLFFDGDTEIENINGGFPPSGFSFPHGGGDVVGIAGWSCGLGACSGVANPLAVAVTLGVPIEIIISGGTYAAHGADGAYSYTYSYAYSYSSFNAQFTDAATGQSVLIFATPEPASWLLLAAGLYAIGLRHRWLATRSYGIRFSIWKTASTLR